MVSAQNAHAQWQQTQTVGTFEIRSEFVLSGNSGSQLVNEMSRLRTDVETLIGFKANDDPIQVNIFRSKGSYQDYLRPRIPAGMSRAALYVKGDDKGRVYVYRKWGFEKDVRHECTHAVLHNAFPYVPLWLDEGFAEYFEVSPSQRSKANPHLGELKRRMLFGWKPSLSRLESREDLTQMTADDYRESWAWVHLALHGPLTIRQTMADYLYDIREGNIAGKFSERLQREIPNADQQLIHHLKRWK